MELKRFRLMKKSVFLLVFVLFAGTLFAADHKYQSDFGTINISAPIAAFPGDALIVKIELAAASANAKVPELTGAKARLKAENAGKNSAAADFYKLKQTNGKYLALLPLDSLLKPGNYNLTLSFAVNGKNYEKTYTVDLVEKDFVSETLQLDAANTAIKTDTSSKRSQQIERLNNILFTTNTDSQYLQTRFVFPVASKRRTSFYGDRRIYAYSNGKSSTSVHFGIDFGDVPTGTVVSSCGRGKVVLVEDRVTTGWSIVIEHMPGLYSLYYHLSKAEVEPGQMVDPGTRIGLSGATGLATGPHLHWELRLLGTAISPDFLVENNIF